MTCKKYRGLHSVVVLCMLLIPALATIASAAVRIGFVCGPEGVYLATTGGEPISIYNILKIEHGFDLYEDPMRSPYYTTTLYNVGFYRFYSMASRLFSRPIIAERVKSMRLVSVFLAGLNLAVVLAYSLGVWNSRERPEDKLRTVIAMASAAIIMSFGSFLNWWPLTVRPDIGAVSLSSMGFVLFLWKGLKGNERAMFLSGCLFCMAWSFKQSTLMLWFCVLLFLLIRRQYRSIAIFAMPLIVVITILIFLLGPNYRINTLFAPSLSSYKYENVIYVVMQLFRKGMLPLMLASLAMWRLSKASWLNSDERQLLKFAWWISLLGGLLTSCRTGSEVNYFFEFWAIATILVLLQAKTLAQTSPNVLKTDWLGRISSIAIIILLIGTALMTTAIDVVRIFGTPGDPLGSILPIDRERIQELSLAGELAQRSKDKVFCQPALAGLAWNPEFPAPIFDDYAFFHRPAQEQGLLESGGLPGQISRQMFGLIVLEANEVELRRLAIAAGYRQEPEFKTFVVLSRPNRPF